VHILVINSGSSSVKYQLIDADDGSRLTHGTVEEVTDHGQALESVVAHMEGFRVDAIGHRVVHGGDRFSEPVLIDDEVIATVDSVAEALEALVPGGVVTEEPA